MPLAGVSPVARSDFARRLLLGLLGVLVDVGDGFLDLRDLLGVLVRYLEPELPCAGHDGLDGVEAVRAEVVHGPRLGGDEILLHTELVHDDLLHTIGNRLHEAPSSCPEELVPARYPMCAGGTAVRTLILHVEAAV